MSKKVQPLKPAASELSSRFPDDPSESNFPYDLRTTGTSRYDIVGESQSVIGVKNNALLKRRKSSQYDLNFKDGSEFGLGPIAAPDKPKPYRKTDWTVDILERNDPKIMFSPLFAGAMLSFADLEELDNETANDVQTQEQKLLYAQRIYKTFTPVRIMLMCLGRWPMTSSKYIDGTRTYEWKFRSIGGAYFLFVTFLVFYTLLMGSINLILISVRPRNATIHGRDVVPFEKMLLSRHLMFFLIIWTSLIHCAISSANFMLKRKYFAFYFTFWSKAMPAMLMDCAADTFRSTMILVCGYIASIASIVILSISRISPSTISAPTLFGVLMFRGIYPDLYTVNKTLVTVPPEVTTGSPVTVPSTGSTTPRWIYGGVNEEDIEARTLITAIGAVFLIIVYAASKAYMFVFIYKCRLLKNAFAQWNGRAYATILKGEPELKKDFGTSTYKLLFRDHCVLIDLIEGTDQLFSTVMESYFALQLTSICFEMYLFLRTARFGTNLDAGYSDGFYIRPHEWIPAVIVFIQSSVLLFLVASYAAEVGEEAMNGMEVLRRRSMMGRKSNDELYFMLTMFASYTAYKRLELSGGGYFYLNKEFILGVVSTILSYFIILYQFQPRLDQKSSVMTDVKFTDRKIFGSVLTFLEGLPPTHYNTEPPKRS